MPDQVQASDDGGSAWSGGGEKDWTYLRRFQEVECQDVVLVLDGGREAEEGV